jgi:hypothetical protein
VFHQPSKKAASASVAGSAAARTYQQRGIAGVGLDAENYGSIQCGRDFDRGAQRRERLEDAGNNSHTSTDVSHPLDPAAVLVASTHRLGCIEEGKRVGPSFQGGGLPMRAIVAGAFMALSVTTAGAQQDVSSASAVLPGCKFYVALADGLDPQPTVPVALAAGYCAAVVDVLASSSALDPVMCLDPDIDKATAMLAFIRYIEARPQRMRERFLILAREALREAWPCVHGGVKP